jgi:hypothetical protein
MKVENFMKPLPRAYMKNDVLNIDSFLDFSDFQNNVKTILEKSVELPLIQRLVIAGSTITDFSFLKLFPSLKQLSFLACNSEKWFELNGTTNVISLRLHNLKQGKFYLPSIAFVRTFPKLEYLYSAMLGIDNFSELQGLNHIHTVFVVGRNENDIKKPFDYSALEFLPEFNVFNTWMAVDRHRIPAESIIPVLRNSSVTSVTVTQLYATERKKLNLLISKINPGLLRSTLSNEELHKINLSSFAW